MYYTAGVCTLVDYLMIAVQPVQLTERAPLIKLIRYSLTKTSLYTTLEVSVGVALVLSAMKFYVG
jgi:hypothetical protein